jgi:hypothetical protein
MNVACDNVIEAGYTEWSYWRDLTGTTSPFIVFAWRDALVATTKARSGLLWVVCHHFQQKLAPNLVQPLLASVPP